VLDCPESFLSERTPLVRQSGYFVKIKSGNKSVYASLWIFLHAKLLPHTNNFYWDERVRPCPLRKVDQALSPTSAVLYDKGSACYRSRTAKTLPTPWYQGLQTTASIIPRQRVAWNALIELSTLHSRYGEFETDH
jgi:hypothetical protein